MAEDLVLDIVLDDVTLDAFDFSVLAHDTSTLQVATDDLLLPAADVPSVDVSVTELAGLTAVSLDVAVYGPGSFSFDYSGPLG